MTKSKIEDQKTYGPVERLEEDEKLGQRIIEQTRSSEEEETAAASKSTI